MLSVSCVTCLLYFPLKSQTLFPSQKHLSIITGKLRNFLFVKLSQKAHNKLPMLSSEETVLLVFFLKKCDNARHSEDQYWVVSPGTILKNKGDIDLWSLSGANPNSSSKQTKLRSLRTSAMKCCLS